MIPETISQLSEVLSDYLSSRLPDHPHVTVTNVKRSHLGGSRAMWSFDADWDGELAISKSLALRADESTCFREPEISLEKEYRVYKALEGTVIPVPKNYWYEGDTRWIGQPFVIREWMNGVESAFTEKNTVEQKRALLDHFVEILAAQHTLNWQDLDLDWLGVPRDTADCAPTVLDRWEKVVHRELLEPYPLMTAAMKWLRSNIPDEVDRIVLNQGQVGPGQFLFRDDRVVASLDWESAYLGDPMSDIAYFCLQVRLHVGDYTEHLLKRYSNLTSIPIRPDNIRFYTVFHVYWGGAACLVAINKFANGLMPSIHSPWLGMGGRPPAAGGPPRTFARRLARLLAEV